MLETNKIYNLDALEFLKQLDEKSVDLMLTDPPYKIKTKQVIELHGRKAMYIDIIEKMGWDKVDIRKLYDDLFPYFDNVVKSNGSVIVFVRTEWITYAIESATKNNFDVKATLTWVKNNPIPQIRKKNYLSSTESILWFARWNDEKCDFTFNFINQKEMHNFIEMPLCGGDERTEHPTQKPLKLMRRLIRIHSNENNLICDPFIGSGTTAVASIMENRNYIGCDNNEGYIKIAQKRIDALPNTKLMQFA